MLLRVGPQFFELSPYIAEQGQRHLLGILRQSFVKDISAQNAHSRSLVITNE